MLETLPPFTPELFWTYVAVLLATVPALVVVAWRKRPPPATPANLADWFDTLTDDEKRSLLRAVGATEAEVMAATGQRTPT